MSMPTHHRESLSIDQSLALRTAAVHLSDTFRDMFGTETIERFLHSSYDEFAGRSEPGTRVNPAAVVAMRERGIDISGEHLKPWTDEVVRAADAVITMGCGDACPGLPRPPLRGVGARRPGEHGSGRRPAGPRRDRAAGPRAARRDRRAGPVTATVVQPKRPET